MSESTVLLSSDVSFHDLGQEAVLFSERQQRLYRVNDIAAFLWLHLQDGLTLAMAADEVSAAFALPAAEARRLLQNVLRQWQELGLIGQHPTGLDDGVAQQSGTCCGLLQPKAASSGRTQRYSAANVLVEICYPDPDLHDLIDPLFAHLRRAASPQPVQARFMLRREATGGFALQVNNWLAAEGVEAAQLLPTMVRRVASRIASLSNARLASHAAALSCPGGTLLLPGVSGSGKSTLAAALMQAGFAYLSDEIVLWDANDRIVPLPLPLCVKQPAWGLIGAMFPELASMPICIRPGDGRIIRYLPPPRASLATGSLSRPRWVVFPRYRAGEALAFAPIPASVGVGKLLSEAVLPTLLDQAGMAHIIAHLMQLAFYELSYKSLADAIPVLAGLCRSPYANPHAERVFRP